MQRGMLRLTVKVVVEGGKWVRGGGRDGKEGRTMVEQGEE